MLEIGKQEDYNVVLKRHIELVASKNGLYKTTLIISPTLYRVVTKVNHLSFTLWLQNAQEKLKKLPRNQTEALSDLLKINWLIRIKSQRRDIDKRIAEKLNI